MECRQSLAWTGLAVFHRAPPWLWHKHRVRRRKESPLLWASSSTPTNSYLSVSRSGSCWRCWQLMSCYLSISGIHPCKGLCCKKPLLTYIVRGQPSLYSSNCFFFFFSFWAGSRSEAVFSLWYREQPQVQSPFLLWEAVNSNNNKKHRPRSAEPETGQWLWSLNYLLRAGEWKNKKNNNNNKKTVGILFIMYRKLIAFGWCLGASTNTSCTKECIFSFFPSKYTLFNI